MPVPGSWAIDCMNYLWNLVKCVVMGINGVRVLLAVYNEIE
jgi:hypothetical protein